METINDLMKIIGAQNSTAQLAEITPSATHTTTD